MYRQILVHPADRDYQRILWRPDSTDVIREYRLNTVTYGLACAPFLAIRTLRQLADDEDARFPRGARTLRQDCYVDDIVTGADTVLDTIALQEELRKLCMAGGFPLRKWASNCQEALHGIPQEHQLQNSSHFWEDESHGTLGLRWPNAAIASRSLSTRTPSRNSQRGASCRKPRASSIPSDGSPPS